MRDEREGQCFGMDLETEVECIHCGTRQFVRELREVVWMGFPYLMCKVKSCNGSLIDMFPIKKTVGFPLKGDKR